MKLRNFPTLLFVVIVVAQSAMIGMVYWTSTVSNDLAKDKSIQLVEQATQAAESNLSILTFDYGLWDQAYDWISARDGENVFDGMGVSATEGPHFHEIYLLDGSGTPIYAYQREGTESDLSMIDIPASTFLYSKVSELPVEPYGVISGFDKIKGDIAVVAAGRVQPRDTSLLGPNDLPTMIAIRYIDDELLSNIALSLLLNGDIKIASTDSAAITSDNAHLALYGLDGSNIASLVWKSPNPGNDILSRAIPIAFIVSFMLMGVTFSTVSLLNKRAKELRKAVKKSETDPLTGVLNRGGLKKLVRSKRGQTALKEGKIALIYLDLNGFKKLNDQAGHKIGDAALLSVAEMLKSSVRPTDEIARLGGDEFVCILFDQLDRTTIESISNRCIKNIKRTISLRNDSHEIDAAVGVAIAQTSQDFDRLLSHADSAMYTAKQRGSSHPVFYAA